MRNAIDTIKPDGLIEVRSFSGNRVISGYFKNRENLMTQLAKYPNETFYIVMNSIDEACYSREQCEKLVEKPKSTTSDKEITRINWMLIDVDPIRASGVSATDEEKKHAGDVINKVYEYLRSEGFPKPVCADSGNGYHLLYKVDLIPGDSEVIKDVLKVLDMYFSDDKASVDTAVFNPSRITKLYGTKARKGTSTAERPHRVSRITRIPEELQPAGKSLLQKIADQLPKQAPNNRPYQAFDARAFLSSHNIRIEREAPFNGGTKLILEECPFDSNHKAPDSAVFLSDNGQIGFKCFHNSCSNMGWKELRQRLEPYQQRVYTKAKEAQEPEKHVSHYIRISDVAPLDRSKIVTIPTGFSGIDEKILGFNKGEMTIWSGGNGSGKSTFLSQLALEAVQRGFNVAMYSGELTAARVRAWMYLQAAGASYVRKSNDGLTWYTPIETERHIDKWLYDKLWLYDNAFGNKAQDIIKEMEWHVSEHKCDAYIVDNLMTMDLGGSEKYEQQTRVVLQLSNLAKRTGIHIHFVCHPRKPTGFLRKTDISGTADITNIADNVIMMHRVNEDFKKSSVDFLGAVAAKRLFEYSNCAEIMKNRDLGVQDEFAGLYFDPRCKQMQGERNANRTYGWAEGLSDCPF